MIEINILLRTKQSEGYILLKTSLRILTNNYKKLKK